MKVISHQRYGRPREVLALTEAEAPSPRPDEVRIRVEAVGINAADWHAVTGEPLVARASFGLRRPSMPVPGRDVVGVVEAVGDQVDRLAVGQRVLGSHGRGGGLAELTCFPQAGVVPLPDSADAIAAAALPLAAGTALQCLEAGGVREGAEVLITGATGGVGSFAVQLARHAGARVTASCRESNADLARRLGADRVLDYERGDPVRQCAAGSLDLVVDVAGNPSLRACRRGLRNDGVMISASGDGRRAFGPLPRMLAAATLVRGGGRRWAFVTATLPTDRLERLVSLLVDGVVDPVVERTYDLTDAAEAMHHVWLGHTRGKVVVTL